MSNQTVVKELTVGDFGIPISGLFVHQSLKGLVSTAGYSVTFSLIPVVGGPAIVDAATAVITGFDPVAGSISVGYALQAGDTASPVDKARVRWRLSLPGGVGAITAPGRSDSQTEIVIHPLAMTG